MKLQSLTPNVMVRDMDETLAFYRDLLGFEVVTSVPEAPPYNWAMIRRDDVVLMLQTRASLGDDLPELKERPYGGALTFFVRMDGVRALHERIHGRVRVVQELTETFYGMREFSVVDPDGFVITFAEPVE